MINITVVGAGAFGTTIATKYKKFNTVKLRAIINRSEPTAATFSDVPYLQSAIKWRNYFGTPGKNDVFDVCVHQNLLITTLKKLVRVGAKNIILPKPIALNEDELDCIRTLIFQNNLKIVIASQWHYSGLVATIGKYITRHRTRISRVDIVFSRSFDANRKRVYNSKTAFLPHIVQILHDIKLISDKSRPIIEQVTDEAIKIRYVEKKKVIRIETDIAAAKREEYLKIYLNDSKVPSLIADFSGVLGSEGYSVFPKAIIKNREIEIREDILEAMIDQHVRFFQGLNSKSSILTFDEYLPVANQVIRIVHCSKKVVGVIGGGVFGILSALEIAKKGYSVIIFEKGKEIIMGASLVNHGRIHMGYHYPRDTKTVIQSLKDKAPFENYFGKSVVKKINNYYMVAKEGSMTDHKNFLAFCKRMHLPYKTLWPADLRISKDKIAVSVKVPETIFDANRMRNILHKQISATGAVTLMVNTQVVDLKRIRAGFVVNYESAGKAEQTQCATIVNATYGGLNHINQLLGLPMNEFQYELCELPVTYAPWGGAGWMIMDGPFFSAMPFGYSNNYLFYDVELSVLERTIGTVPKFRYGIEYYDTKERRAKRFNKYMDKWKSWIGGIENCKHFYSMYATRIVLPKAENTDKRPTVVSNPIPGYWQIFSGKLSASVPKAIELGNKVDTFLKRIV